MRPNGRGQKQGTGSRSDGGGGVYKARRNGTQVGHAYAIGK